MYKHFFSVLNAKEMNIFSRNQFTHRPLETETQTKFMHLVLCTEGEYNFFSDEINIQFQIDAKTIHARGFKNNINVIKSSSLSEH